MSVKPPDWIHRSADLYRHNPQPEPPTSPVGAGLAEAVNADYAMGWVLGEKGNDFPAAHETTSPLILGHVLPDTTAERR